MQLTFSKFVDDTKLGEVTDKPDGCALSQKDLAGWRKSEIV